MPETAATRSPGLSKAILGAFAFQLVALAAAGWFYRHALNPDAVAYLRIGSYYAQGNMALALSGYWSPLISWVLAPLLKAGLPPLVSARLFMGFSAVFFMAGSVRVFRACNLEPKLLVCGTWLAAILSIPWSVENITPDLLLAGLVSFAVAGMLRANRTDKSIAAFGTGLWWGVAYLCKAIALPMAVLCVGGMAVLHSRQRGFPRTFRSGVLVLLGLALVSLPWIGVISAKRGALTVSESAMLNHALAGPSVQHPLFLLDQGFHPPEPGRITRWENPTLPYPQWSPFASWRNAIRQIEVIVRNAVIVTAMLTSVSLAFPIILVLLWPQLCRRTGLVPDVISVLQLAMPVVALAILFLPNYVLISEQRYFYPTFPFLFVLGVRVLICPATGAGAQRVRLVLLILSFLCPVVARELLRSGSSRLAGQSAWVLAGKMRAAGLAGPIAGSARLPGGRAGLYVAYHLDQSWYGDEPSASPSSLRASGARFFVVKRGTSLAHELARDPHVQNADAKLFATPNEARQFPLEVFESSLVTEGAQ